MRIIPPEERMAGDGFVKGVIFGEAKVGKTSQLWTLDPATTLFVDLEAGGLSVAGWGGDSIKVRDWLSARNLACLLGGPDPAKRSDEPYSEAHYSLLVREYPEMPQWLAKYQTIFIDSITVAGRLCFHWSQGQPAARTKSGAYDGLGAYGLHGQEMIRWVTHLQHVEGKNIWLVGLLDRKKDDLKREYWEPQIEGSKASLELPGIMDQVISMVILEDDRKQPYRAFVCHKKNPWGYPAGDRSRVLNCVEHPHLGFIMNKIKAGPQQSAAATLTYDLP